MLLRGAEQFLGDPAICRRSAVPPQHPSPGSEGRGALRQGGLRPHNFCLPILKREVHREAVLAAATSGHPRFFLGTDSAPHARSTKVPLLSNMMFSTNGCVKELLNALCAPGSPLPVVSFTAAKTACALRIAFQPRLLSQRPSIASLPEPADILLS